MRQTAAAGKRRPDGRHVVEVDHLVDVRRQGRHLRVVADGRQGTRVQAARALALLAAPLPGLEALAVHLDAVRLGAVAAIDGVERRGTVRGGGGVAAVGAAAGVRAVQAVAVALAVLLEALRLAAAAGDGGGLHVGRVGDVSDWLEELKM